MYCNGRKEGKDGEGLVFKEDRINEKTVNVEEEKKGKDHVAKIATLPFSLRYFTL